MSFCVSNYCPGCGDYLSCRCGQVEAAHAAHRDDSYTAGYDAAQADGYDQRPMAEWVYRSDVRHTYEDGPDGRRRLVRRRVPVYFAELTWRRYNATEGAYRRWFEREYVWDLESYLEGYDDAGAGLPSAVGDPERHRLCAEALDAYEPEPDLYDRPLGPWPAPAPVEDGMPF